MEYRERNGGILKMIRETIRICTEEPSGYELRLRNLLSEIWVLLSEVFR